MAVLLSAVMHAGWNFLVKASSDRLLDTVTIAVGGSFLAALTLPFVPPPLPESRWWLGCSVFVHIAYFLALVESYKHADLSVAYPLMRGCAPVIVALCAPLFGEPYHSTLFIGIGLVGLGIIFPVVIGFGRCVAETRGLPYALCNSAVIALYTILDGVGVRHSGSAAAYTLWLFFFDAWGILAVALWYRGGDVIRHLAHRWMYGISAVVIRLGA
ncbi:EamA family transporter [Propionivibrio soli]|uniref:EamA family transporter n=1 Tax=Propionivibrio soli TaxID=2976531 RepID=UPI0021E75785|nr:EamA family transporter [Propionivibrio soli]